VALKRGDAPFATAYRLTATDNIAPNRFATSGPTFFSEVSKSSNRRLTFAGPLQALDQDASACISSSDAFLRRAATHDSAFPVTSLLWQSFPHPSESKSKRLRLGFGQVSAILIVNIDGEPSVGIHAAIETNFLAVPQIVFELALAIHMWRDVQATLAATLPMQKIPFGGHAATRSLDAPSTACAVGLPQEQGSPTLLDPARDEPALLANAHRRVSWPGGFLSATALRVVPLRLAGVQSEAFFAEHRLSLQACKKFLHPDLQLGIAGTNHLGEVGHAATGVRSGRRRGLRCSLQGSIAAERQVARMGRMLHLRASSNRRNIAAKKSMGTTVAVVEEMMLRAIDRAAARAPPLLQCPRGLPSRAFCAP
jgi:hypothetical protein